MTAEHVFKLYRAYKFFYDGKCRFDHGVPVLKHPPLSDQYDRQFYHRIAQKMGDAQIHALFIIGFFYRPYAHISDFVTPDAQRAALRFAGREENGRTLLEHDLYALGKRLAPVDIQTWLYGITASTRQMFPGCVQEVITGELSPDLACALLLIQQPEHQLHWLQFWASQPNTGLGPHVWIDRLVKLDQLLNMTRNNWRGTAQSLARQFWTSYPSLAPQLPTPVPSLF